MSSFIAGFSLGISLILAIGAQNAFVLKQGLKKHHVFVVCFICALSDAVLIAAGVAGFGVIVKQYPQIELLARYAGAIFLVAYGLKSFYSALTSSHSMEAEGELLPSVYKTVLACLAFTWLNPHVYLDTVVLLGSISTQYEGTKLLFASGAMFGSFVFFFSLGYGARVLIPVFQKPLAWKILEFFIGFIMLFIAASLVL
jgi:L-lysine exporter family protein LysE/ArgO